MAVLDPNEIFFTPFEPKQQNRFVLYADGFPAYLIKALGAVSVTQGTVPLNHINIQRFVNGKTTWGTIDLTLYAAITLSGSKSILEWVILHHDSVTGRYGYADL